MPPPSREALWRAGKDETVEVNQRALIDKILARYSGEHTIFRELLQNADDAGAQHVQVHFYTKAGIDAHDAKTPRSGLPEIKREPIHRYVVLNDGIPFRDVDWARLKKIAEGNPDEEKIGAFGVGFYSLWSVCDDPFVESGSKWMGFYWKDGKDQLLARSGDLPPTARTGSNEPSATGHPWTAFTMALREPAPLEAPLDFARFLVTSLTFMRTIKKIDMVVDDIKVLEVRKDVKGQHRVSRSGLSNTSTMSMMKVQGVDATSMVITARVMKWLSATGVAPPPLPPAIGKPSRGLFASFFGRNTPEPVAPTPPPAVVQEENPREVDVLAREIRIFQADVKVSVSPSFARELERATKKAPPSRMPASLVYSREDETLTAADGSKASDKKASAVFSGLCPPLDSDKSARVFIGQPTSQTTGIGGHLSARFIPTVERESIDMVDRHVSHWNKELLWVGGYLARLIYEIEMVELQQQWSRTTATETEARTQLLSRALYALRFFSFKASTPSAAVGAEMESAFFKCSTNNQNLLVPSTAGIRPVKEVRMPKDVLQEFLPDLPVVTADMMKDALRAVNRLVAQDLLHEPQFEDVVKQLNARPLTEKEMIACLDWWKSIADMSVYNSRVRDTLLGASILITENNKVVPLNQVRTYVNVQASSIPTDMPLPPDTMPYTVTRQWKGADLKRVFGWEELSVPAYMTFLVNPPLSNHVGADPATDVRTSAEFAERVLQLIGRAWQSMAASQHTATAMLLKDVAMIPTRAGFKKPGEAYFEKVQLFDDLPTIALPKTQNIKGGLEKALLGLGVRRTVDLQLVFSRLVGGGEWTCKDLVMYLVSVKDTLSPEELARLKQTSAFPLEQPASPDGPKTPLARRKPFELYEPVETLRVLGLPMLDWGEHKWRSNSPEAVMMHQLGLKRHPPIDTLLAIAAGRAPTNIIAFNYLLEHLSTHYLDFDPTKFSGVAFIPATSSRGEAILAKPGEVFTNSGCQILGFAVARPPASAPVNASKLGIQSDPPMDRLVAAFLTQLTSDADRARSVFEYLATRLGTAQVASTLALANKAFIPVPNGEKSTRLARPDEVYFKSRDGVDPLYASTFTFIDFGDSANLFLRHCGVKSEPSHKDIARLLLRDPERMLRQAGSADKYLDQLRLLAVNLESFDARFLHEMKQTPFVLGSLRVPSGESKSTGAEDRLGREWVLCRASDCIIVDSSSLLQFFGAHALAAPEEEALERFYTRLGATPLSSRVKTEFVSQGVRQDVSKNAAEVRRHTLERLTLFLGQGIRGTKDTALSADWLNRGSNFVVREADVIKARYTYVHGRERYEHFEDLYAMAQRPSRLSEIVLTVSLYTHIDNYDVAAALVPLVMKKPGHEDILILDSFLSTPLMSLRKRGINVDRILNQQKHEEKLRLKAAAAQQREAAADAKAREAGLIEAPPPYGGAGAPAGTAVSTETAGGTAQAGRAPTQKSLLESGGFLDSLRSRIGASMGGMGGPVPTPDQTPVSSGTGADAGAGGGSRHGAGAANPTQTARPTDPDNIPSRNEDKQAIQSSRNSVANVSESQNQYCDSDTSADHDLKIAYTPVDPEAECKIWSPSDAGPIDATQLALCRAFATEILVPLASVYGLSPKVVSVFWDRSGPLIAFNRSGAIFCNARYYEAWHAAAVRAQQPGEAFISWYFTLAHELAHNLESAHNASHEFYFSSIAEEYLLPFVRLLGSRSALAH